MTQKKIAGIIPARYASVRFPGKPLVVIRGKSMVMRVYDRACKAKSLDEVVVATDDNRIYDHVMKHGGKVVLTRDDHNTGTERCAEVARGEEFKKFSHFINIQGDEPFIEPGQIDLLTSCFEEEGVLIATLAKPFFSEESLFNENTVKVAVQNNGNALYFSRSVIPFYRSVPEAKWLSKGLYKQHVGIYGYTRSTLLDIAALPPGILEKAESLEQLRWLEAGISIKVKHTDHENFAIDTPGDLEKLLRWLSDKS
jgi:3-deoxy-manno-octulosonate cytidylyltransferase (CMP-KDO synthetase)